MLGGDVEVRVEAGGGGGGDDGLGLAHVRALEEELAVEVRHVDRVQVDDGHPPEPAQRQVLQQLAAWPPRRQ